MGPSGGMNIDPRVEVLSGVVPVGAEALTSRLDRSHVVIRTSHAHGALALATANLLARLVPSVEIECTDDSFVTIPVFGARSEEHTSELQSLRHLVCRLLLE